MNRCDSYKIIVIVIGHEISFESFRLAWNQMWHDCDFGWSIRGAVQLFYFVRIFFSYSLKNDFTATSVDYLCKYFENLRINKTTENSFEKQKSTKFNIIQMSRRHSWKKRAFDFVLSASGMFYLIFYLLVKYFTF